MSISLKNHTRDTQSNLMDFSVNQPWKVMLNNTERQSSLCFSGL